MDQAEIFQIADDDDRWGSTIADLQLEKLFLLLKKVDSLLDRPWCQLKKKEYEPHVTLFSVERPRPSAYSGSIGTTN